VTPREFEHLLDLMEPEQPDDWAFWRGLGVGLCISGCAWLAIGGGVWAAFKGVMCHDPPHDLAQQPPRGQSREA
jgi:hypothetical protein